MAGVNDLGLHRRLRQAEFTYDWCDDDTSVVNGCPQCEVPSSTVLAMAAGPHAWMTA